MMERQQALFFTVIFLIIVIALAYYGARVTLWSSIVIGVFLSLILLNLLYPVSEINSDEADASLVVYALFEIVSVILLFAYITQKSLSDVRNSY